MTQHQLNKHWDVIEAFKNGKKIQILRGGEWHDVSRDVSFDAATVYRIKPEPVLIPFDYSDAEFLLGKKVKSVDGTLMAMVHAVGETSGVRAGYITYSYEDFLKTFTFLDGSPCGKPKV